MRDDILRLVEREVKRAVEKERGETVALLHARLGHARFVDDIAAAIRGRK